MESSRYKQDLYSAYSSSCEKHSGNVLFIFEGREITYGETISLVRRRAAFLQKKGYKRGDVIGMLSVNSPDWCVTFMAITSIGAVVLPMDTSLQAAQIGPMLDAAGAVALFISEGFRGMVKNLPVFEIGTDGNMEDEKGFARQDISCDEMAALLFTSGTTGTPKMVSLSHMNILHVAVVCTDLEEYVQQDVTLALLPLFHIYALEATFMAPLVSGSSIVMLNSLKGPDIMKALSEHPISIFPAAPLMWELFFKGLVAKLGAGSAKYYIFMFFVKNARILRAMGLGFLVKKIFKPVHAAFGLSHRFFISGGAPLKREYFMYYRNMGFQFIEGYGLSETTGPIAIPYYKKSKAGSVGPPIPGNEVIVKNINEDGIGEIWFKGDAVMKGYYKNEAANLEVFDTDGFFNTGDLGRVDSAGNIFVTGRMKNVIVLDSGKKAYPEELEFYFKQSSLISEIAVFDRNVDGRVQIYAVIVPVSKSRDIYSLVKAEVESLNRGLPDYRRVRSFAVSMDELPKNSTKKILYNEVKALLDAGMYQAGEDDSAVLRDVLKSTTVREEEIIGLLRSRFSGEDLFTNQTLADFGVDSLGMIDLVVWLESSLRVSIDMEEFMKKQNLGEVLLYLASLEVTEGASLDDYILRSEIKRRPRRFFNPLYHLLIGLFGFLSRLFWKVKLVNGERLVPDNSIIIANHQSFMDMIWMSFSIPRKYRKDIYVTGKKKFSFLRFVLPVFPILLLDDRNSVEVLKANADLLRQGKSLLIFPEGTRSPDGNMQHFKSGAAYLARNLDRKVIPVAINGAFDVWPRQKKMFRITGGIRGSVCVGEALTPSGYDSVESLNEAMERAVGDMIRKDSFKN